MQTERVTFLATPDQKAALEAFAAAHGKSVGHVVREATSRYIAEGEVSEQEELALLLQELDEAVPRMRDQLQRAIESVDATNRYIDEVLARPERKP